MVDKCVTCGADAIESHKADDSTGPYCMSCYCELQVVSKEFCEAIYQMLDELAPLGTPRESGACLAQLRSARGYAHLRPKPWWDTLFTLRWLLGMMKDTTPANE